MSLSAAVGIKPPPGIKKKEVRYYPDIGNGGADEILRPTLMTVGDQGRCYRIVTDSFGRKDNSDWTRGTATAAARAGGAGSSEYKQDAEVEESSHNVIFHSHDHRHGNGGGRGRKRRMEPAHQPYIEDVYDEGQESGLHLEGLESIPSERGGGFSLSLPIPATFFKYVIGAKGVTRSNIEEDTKCKLRIPRKGQDGDLVIEGATPAVVAHGKQRVEMVVWNSRFKEEPNFFISIPLNISHLMDALQKFQQDVMDVCGRDKGVVTEVFQEPKLFHITLGVLRIFSEQEMDKAIRVIGEALDTARRELLDPSSGPLTIELESLDTMRDDLPSARVVYSKVGDSTQRLQKFVDRIVGQVVREAPEMMRLEFQREGVKLHATVMNAGFLSRYAEEEESSREMEVYRGRRRQKPRDNFDATRLFEHFKNYNFGRTDLTNLHLSKRSARDLDGYYKCMHNYSV